MKGKWLVDETKISDEVTVGDLLFFDGSGETDVVGIVTHVLSDAIEVLTRCDWSHVAMVLPGGKDIIESTIRKGISGPQVNPLVERAEECDGPSVWYFRMMGSARAQIDWDAAITFARSRVGVDKYSVSSLFDFVLRPLLPFLHSLRKSHRGEEVCSEFIAMIYQAGGMTGLNPHETSPGDLVKKPIWLPPVQIWKRDAAPGRPVVA